MGNVLTALADLFLPRLCCVCGGELGRNERCICLNCLVDMPLTLHWTVRRNPMAEKFNALIAEHEASAPVAESGASALTGEPDVAVPIDEPDVAAPADCYSKYADAVALFNFVRNGVPGDTEGDTGNAGTCETVRSTGGYRNITYRLKYSRDIREGRFFAAMLGERASRAEWFSDVDTVVPVPLHWTRRLRRGYNQAEVIASEVAKALGARLRTDILARRRRTSSQTKLGIEEKARNVRGAFVIGRKFRIFSGKRKSAPFRHILLVDDVFTTGSTLYNCWLPLHEFFGPSVRISIATLGVV